MAVETVEKPVAAVRRVSAIPTNPLIPAIWRAKDLSIAENLKHFPEASECEYDPLLNVKKVDAQKSQVVRSATTAGMSPKLTAKEFDDPLSKMAILAAAESASNIQSATVLNDPLGANLAVGQSRTPELGGRRSPGNLSASNSFRIQNQQRRSSIMSNASSVESAEIIGVNSDCFVPWAMRRVEILEKFTTSEKLNISLDGVGGTSKASALKGNAVEEKIARRLDQLEEMAETGMTGGKNLSQREYIAKIDEMNSGFMTAWNNEEKVKAFKIVIQCVKLLVDTSVTEFYPSKFVLVTDIVETFGKAVYKRLKLKSSFLPEDFTPDQVPDSVKELARNWFYKIYSVREMLPRLYAETAVLRCYRFLTMGEYKSALARISRMIRGIGDPLVAIYTRAYLCRACMQLAPEYRDCLMDNFNDFLLCLDQLRPPVVSPILAGCNIELPAYYQLFLPAVEWVLQCVICDASETGLDSLKKTCEQHIILKHAVFSTFPPEYICGHLQYFTDFISEAKRDEVGVIVDERQSRLIVRKSELYRILGEKCLHGRISSIEETWELLSDVWKAVLKLDNIQEFMRVANVWLEFSAKCLTPAKVELILKGLIKHVMPDRKYEKILNELTDSVRCMFRQSSRSTCAQLLSLESFLAILDLFQSDQAKRYEVNHMILEMFVNSTSNDEPISDPVVINALLRIGKNLHDNLSSFSNKSVTQLARELTENGQGVGGQSHTTVLVSELILKMLDRITFNDDFEAQLSFYVEARGSFFLLESVIVELVHRVNAVTMETLRRMPGGKHNKRTSSFIRACIAFCIITVPSIENIITRLTLYLNTAQVALWNCSTAQADALFASLISTIQYIPPSVVDTSANVGPSHRSATNRTKSTEHWVVAFSANLFSSLLMMPDYPSQGILFHFKAAIQQFASYPFPMDSQSRFSITMNAVKALSSFAQAKWSLKVPYVDNNGDLYGYCADKKYQSEMNRIGRSLIAELDKEVNTNAALTVPLVTEYIRTIHYFCPSSSEFVVNTSEKYIPNMVLRSSFKDKIMLKGLLNYARKELKREASLANEVSPHLEAAMNVYRKLASAIPDTK